MRIVHAMLALGLLGVMGCAASTGSDPQAVESLKQVSVKMLSDLDAGDFQAMFADADPNIVVMDFDENNAPMRVNGSEEAKAFMTRMTELSKSQGLKFTSTMIRNDASVIGTMGYSIVEYDQTISAGGQTMGPFKFRGTLIARREGNTWITTHWHGSFREMPPAMAASDSTAAH